MKIGDIKRGRKGWEVGEGWKRLRGKWESEGSGRGREEVEGEMGEGR